MDARTASAPAAAPADKPKGHHGPARWARPLVRMDAMWTKIETYLVLFALLCAILYMSGWVTLNAFYTKGGKLAYYPGIIACFAGAASLAAWFFIVPKNDAGGARPRKPRGLILPCLLLLLGAIFLLVAPKRDYFANIATWLQEGSVIKLIGPYNLVSARLFTIWVALLGGSLATSAGRQINIDVVMRFLGPRMRLVVALLGYAVAASACFTISWAFVDYVSITGYGADKDATPTVKIKTIGSGLSRHFFVARKQIALDLRSSWHVVVKGEAWDSWYPAEDWNKELNEGGWASVYPPRALTADEQREADARKASGAPSFPVETPCLTDAESTAFSARGGQYPPEWQLPQKCHDPGSKLQPIITAPAPDNGAPLEADLGLLFPWGFLMIGCRFLLRGALALGGAVSTDPDAAHGGDGAHAATEQDPKDPTAPKDDDALVSVHEPLVEKKVDEEARAHEGEGALPADDLALGDALDAAASKVDAGVSDLDNDKRGLGGEPAHHVVEPLSEGKDARDRESTRRVRPAEIERDVAASKQAEAPADEAPAPKPSRPPSMPPEGLPTAQRLETAQKLAEDDEDQRTLVGDLSELARAQELLAEKERASEEKKKKAEEEKAKGKGKP